MTSKWQSLVQQKLFLARELLIKGGNQDDSAAIAEARRQGAVQLILQARRVMLALIAHIHQQWVDRIRDLKELADVVGEDNQEYLLLQLISTQSGSWWQRLDQLESWFERPVPERKTVQDDNIIAFAVDQGPDVSSERLVQLVADMKLHLQQLMERHGEW